MATPQQNAVDTIIATAMREEGLPYKFGGESPGKYFDCSGLAQYCASSAHITIPRTTYSQWAAIPRIGYTQTPMPGDFVYFAGSDGTKANPGHVGICTGYPYMIDAPYTGTVVRNDKFNMQITTGDMAYVGACRPSLLISTATTLGKITPANQYPTIKLNTVDHIDTKHLQTYLNQHGFRLVIDGTFGVLTHSAVVDFQKKAGLIVDGVVGPATWAKLAG